MIMAQHLDYDDPQYAASAAEILRRHDNAEAEANITSAVRDFLILTKLVKNDEISEENPPSDTSRSAVDLTALDTFVEMKRRTGTTGGLDPNPVYVRQLDDYLSASAKSGKGLRTGILTDGKHWLLRWPGAGRVKTVKPYAFTLQDAQGWLLLYEWLRDESLVSLEGIAADRANIEKHLGPNSPLYERDIAALRGLFDETSHHETIKVKRQLWFDLLRAALGEVAGSPEQLDDLFVRHTYLSMVIGMAVQASFGIDIRQVAASDPADLLHGRAFWNATGLQGIVESDFFAWPTEVGGLPSIRALARRIAKFDWRDAPADIGAALYETVIPPEERRTLGEYYTPDWLARVMVRELVTDPLNQRVLDPACGSGTFVAEAVTHYIEAAKGSGQHPKQVLDRLLESVGGIDVHPVAVHLARAAWALAARPAIDAVMQAGFDAQVSVPIYLGDALQLRLQTGDMFAEHSVTIQVADEQNTELVFPVSLVERANDFDSLMSDVAAYIENGEDPNLALDDNHINDPAERGTLAATIATLQGLHSEGRDHIWAYYTRNLVRPVALARRKVDVIIGNPPWINYNQTASILRAELERQSKDRYGIWQGGRYATHQDVAGLFFTRSMDLYLKDGGVIGMVMPHSALQTGQYAKWRTGKWQVRAGGTTLAADFSVKTAWDLERLEPNTFFPVPASVAFAKRLEAGSAARALSGNVESWRGKAGTEDDVTRESVGITDTSVVGESVYDGHTRNGATVFPRGLFIVTQTENTAIIQAGQTVTVNPQRGSQSKEPWRSLDLTAINGQTIESRHIFDVHLGETLVPYATLDPLKAILPMKQADFEIPVDANGVGGIRLSGLERRMRDRWRTISGLWDTHKQPVNKLNLFEQLDYLHKLSVQLEWKQNPGLRPIRVLYNQSGTPTAALLDEDYAVVDYTLYWITCKDIQEANYLLAIINSQALYDAVTPLMAKGQFGARHLQKHLWKLPIPEFDPRNRRHVAIAKAGEAAAQGAVQQLEQLREQRDKVTVTVARRELRRWLRESKEGKAVERVVGRLLGG